MHHTFKTTTFLIFINYKCNGQDSKNLKIGIYFSPEYQYRTLTARDEGIIKQKIKPDRDSTETYRISYNAGISIQYSFSQNLSLRSGLFFSDRGMILKRVPTCRPGPSPNCITGWVGRLDGVDTVESIYKIGFVSLPVLLQYDLNISKNKVGIFTGLSADYLLFAIYKITEYGPDNTSLTYNSNFKNPGFYDFVYNFIVGLNFEREINERISLALEPTFRYSSSIVRPPGIQANLYSYGLGFNFKYKIQQKVKKL